MTGTNQIQNQYKSDPAQGKNEDYQPVVEEYDIPWKDGTSRLRFI